MNKINENKSGADLSDKLIDASLQFREIETIEQTIDKQNDENAALRYNNPVSAIENSQEILKQSKEINYDK